MSQAMDYETAEHFYRWLEATVRDDEQHAVEQKIHALLEADPELLNGRSWPELLRMAEALRARGAGQ